MRVACVHVPTISGKVRILHTWYGTHTSSIPTFGSGEMTVRAEKLTRFPAREHMSTCAQQMAQSRSRWLTRQVSAKATLLAFEPLIEPTYRALGLHVYVLERTTTATAATAPVLPGGGR